jgi:EmrB/QacA subfamily drug resistance transporter
MKEDHPRRWLILAALMLGSIIGPITGSAINISLPTIATFFEVEIATAQWIRMIFLVSVGSFLLTYGRLGDLFGFKRIYLIGLGGFIFSSVLCAFSNSIAMLIGCQALQGLFAGMMDAMPFAIITAIFPPAERGKAIGITFISIALGLAIGPFLGGTVAGYLSWRYIFLVTIPIGLAAFIWAKRIIPESERASREHLDLPGAITAFVFFLCFLMLLNQGQQWGWTSKATIGLIVGTVLSGAAFIRLEKRASQPMLNLKLFRHRTFSFANLSALLNFASQYIIVFLTPFYLQRELGYLPQNVGKVMTALPLVVLVVAPISGILSDRIGTRFLSSLGAAICAGALFLMTGWEASSGQGEIMGCLALFGLGTGLFQSPNSSAVMSSAPQEHLGIASGVLATMRNVGMAMGIAIGGTILYARLPIYQSFLLAVQDAYFVGAILTGIAALTSLVHHKAGNIQSN